MRRFLILLLVCLVGGGGYYLTSHGSAAQTKSPEKSRSRPVPVVIAAAVTKPMPVQLSTIGRVQTAADVAVRSRIDGQIVSAAVADGQEVKTGDVLFTLDDRQAQAALHQAQANLAKDRAQLENARRELDRVMPLSQREFASRQSVDQARAAVAMAEATVHSDEALVENAQVQLSYCVIRAPINGRIGTIASKVGNAVRANDTTPLLTINQIRPIYVAFSVPQKEFAAIQQAMAAGPLPIAAVVPGDTRGPLSGKVAYLENAIDTATNTLSIKASFANEQNRLWPGQFVNVTATLAVQPDAVVVPSEAVQTGQNGSFVFVVRPDSTVEARPVTVSRTVGSEAVVETGLAAGETVVTNGQLRLDNGIKVEVRPAGNEAAKESLS